MEKENNINFLALAIHKLKTPTSSIKLSSEMLLEGDFGELADEQKKVIERMHQKNEGLIDLIDDLLKLAKTERKASFHTAPVDFEKLVRSVTDYEKEYIEKKEITVKLDGLGSKLPKITLDKEKMFLAIQNIVDNAIKYSRKGGQITISLGSDQETVTLKIQDKGIGILNEERGRLFTEFFRGENAKELEPAGSGLGLYIAKDIIENHHHGKIWFESEENKGTTFYISLPIK